MNFNKGILNRGQLVCFVIVMETIFLNGCSSKFQSASSSADVPGVDSATVYTHFVSTTGSDSNTCTSEKPCLTLSRAITVASTSLTATIKIGPGVFTTSNQIDVPPNISIVGSGASTVIKAGAALISWPFSLFSLMSSSEAVNGNQSISQLTIDGNNLLADRAIFIRGRSNVEIHHITVRNFGQDGVTFSGRGDETDAPPTIYASGNSFHDNTVSNSSLYSGYGHGELQIGGQDGMLVYNNSFDQTSRAYGSNGYLIKYYRKGYLRGVKIYDNILTKNKFEGNFDFTVEFWNVSGVEMYNNISTGSFDINTGSKTSLGKTYLYSFYAHHNIIGPEVTTNTNETGINLEATADGDLRDVLIEKNFFRNLKRSVYFYLHVAGIGIYETYVSNNIFYKSSALIVNSADMNAVLAGVYFRNNTIWSDSTSGSSPYNGYDAFDGAVVCQQSNYVIENNIVVGSARSFMFFWNGGVGKGIAGVTMRNNIIFGNGTNSYADNDVATTNAITGRVFTGNIIASPQFLLDGIDFNLGASSPGKNAGYSNGVLSDYDENVRSSSPSIGAFE